MKGAGPRPWREAWQDALYGPDGFYRRPEGPAGHFTTSTHGPLGAVFASAIGAMADWEGCDLVVDVGAGRGELLGQLADQRTDLRLLGVDIVERPAGLPASVEWLVSPGGASLPHELSGLDRALVIAHEWLDVVPCTIALIGPDGVPRQVEVAADGTESAGDPVAARDRAWADRHWSTVTPGDRVEVGLTRDGAWSELLSRVRSGAAVAVDYGHTRERRPASGTLLGYLRGVAQDPVPDGSMDITAHVAMDSLEHDELLTQREALRRIGLTPATPAHDLARSDPAGYLAALSHTSAVTALTDPGGLGGFLWAITRKSLS